MTDSLIESCNRFNLGAKMGNVYHLRLRSHRTLFAHKKPSKHLCIYYYIKQSRCVILFTVGLMLNRINPLLCEAMHYTFLFYLFYHVKTTMPVILR